MRWYFLLPIILVVVGLVIPLSYLIVRALDADPSRLQTLILSTRNAHLLWNTVVLALGVLAVGTIIAFPLAWLTARTDLRPAKLYTVIGVLPLAVPGYVLAYVILSITGSYGTLARYLGVDVPTLSGYWGALLALSLYTSPYLFLNLRAAMMRLDPTLEEAGQSLGYGQMQVFLRVTLPQLRPAYLAGALLVVLHVMGDFGVVSLMRFETFSLAIYVQFAGAFERTYAALLALMLLSLTAILLVVEARLLRDLRLDRSSAISHARGLTPLGRWRPLAVAYCAALGTLSLGIPVASIIGWVAVDSGFEWSILASPLWNAVIASAPAALAATLLAVPLSYLSVRFPSAVTRSIERASYLGYALPPLALALAYIFFSLSAAPGLYQTLWLLIFAYTLHFVAEAIGPVRSALYQAPPHVEEAARSLGRTPLRAFASATLPLIRTGIVVSMAFVFLSALKELPLTVLLAPPGFETLSLNVWSYTNEAMYAPAAPYALSIIVLSALFVGLLIRHERSGRIRPVLHK
ncbi:MAG: iron ABC transporter permease [Rhodothermia bacterium]|nr:iron ABC transporter permease [Rhodothermia bacterium]